MLCDVLWAIQYCFGFNLLKNSFIHCCVVAGLHHATPSNHLIFIISIRAAIFARRVLLLSLNRPPVAPYASNILDWEEICTAEQVDIFNGAFQIFQIRAIAISSAWEMRNRNIKLSLRRSFDVLFLLCSSWHIFKLNFFIALLSFRFAGRCVYTLISPQRFSSLTSTLEAWHTGSQAKKV